MFYLKLVLIGLWCALSSIVGLLYALFNHNNPRVFANGLKIVSWGVLKILGIKVICENVDIVDGNQPCIYVGNHQSSLDVITYSQIMPKKTTAVAKSEVKWVPLVGWWFWAVGGSFIHRRNRIEAIRELEALAERLNREKLSVAMMPEGTRNKAGRGLLPFKKGPFHLAILAQVPIVPVLSSPFENLAHATSRTLRPGTVTIRAFDPIPTKGLTSKDVDALSERVRAIMLKGMEELGHPPGS